jgi:hypothetical protein
MLVTIARSAMRDAHTTAGGEQSPPAVGVSRRWVNGSNPRSLGKGSKVAVRRKLAFRHIRNGDPTISGIFKPLATKHLIPRLSAGFEQHFS